MRRAAIASVSVSAFLVAIKAGAYFASHSVAMLASLADSALDLFASSLNLIAIRHALTPAEPSTASAMARPSRWPAWRRAPSSPPAHCSWCWRRWGASWCPSRSTIPLPHWP
jgi:hypothetical protein